MSNNLKFNMKDNIKSNIKKEDEVSVLNTNDKVENEKSVQDESVKFRIGRKKEDKSEKKSFPLYVDGSIQKDLDKIVKKTGYSRNELINMMIKYCLDNIEFED